MTEVQFAKQFLTTLDSKNTKYQSDHVFDPRTFQMRIPYTLPKLSHPPHPLPPKPTPSTAPAPGSQPITQATSTTIDVTLKSTRNPAFTLHLPSLPQTTPITTLKAQIQTLLSGTVPDSKIKILHNKKPIPPSKSTVHDVLSDTSTDEKAPTSAEFGVMVMGGAPDPTPAEQTINLNNESEAAGPGSENAALEAVTGVNPEDLMKGVTNALEAEQYSEKDGLLSQSDNVQSEPVQPGQSSGREILGTGEFWEDLRGFLEQRLRDTAEAERLVGLFRQVAK